MSRTCVIVLIGATILRCQAASETCSGGKEWQQCATACPLTCNNYDTAPVVCTESCIEGCVCPEGKVELDGVCVEPSTCTRCSLCKEGQQCSAVLADDCVNVLCKDPIAVPCSPDVPLTCPTNGRCLTHNTTGTSFCLESCFMQNGGCSSDQTCHSVRTKEPCNPLLKPCFTISCHMTQTADGVCPVGWELNECGSLCQRTCEDYLTNSHKDYSDDTCAIPACVCPEGLVEYEDRCVDPLECHTLIYNVVVGWEYISHHVYEDDGVVEVCATVYTADNVECPISFSFNIMTTLDPNEDYDSSAFVLQFAACEKRQCVNVTIVNDDKFKGNSSISVTLERASNLDSRIILTPADARINIFEDETFNHKCYTDRNCQGFSFPMANASSCCVETDDGMSYSEDGECIVRQCIVHGFAHAHASYTVIEGETLNTIFKINIKGMTHFHSLLILGSITSTPTTAQTGDFEAIEYQTGGERSEISLVTINDTRVEYDESVILRYDHRFMSVRLAEGEFIRDTATVNIIDNDFAVLSVERSFYEVSLDEGVVEVCTNISTPITECPIEFPFEVRLRSSETTAVTSMDNITFWFDACKVRSCANVSIVGAMINGPYEIFHVSLELISYLDCKIGLEHDHATINITNYVPEVGLENTIYEVSEDVGVVEVCVVVKAAIACPFDVSFTILLYTRDSIYLV